MNEYKSFATQAKASGSQTISKKCHDLVWILVCPGGDRQEAE